MKPEVTRMGILDMQVCVPKIWTDQQIMDFANQENITGLSGGWKIRKEGDKFLSGDPERQQCLDRKDYCHVMLDC